MIIDLDSLNEKLPENQYDSLQKLDILNLSDEVPKDKKLIGVTPISTNIELN